MDLYSIQYKKMSESLREFFDSEKISEILDTTPIAEDKPLRRTVMVLIADTLLGLSDYEAFNTKLAQILEQIPERASIETLIQAKIFTEFQEEIQHLSAQHMSESVTAEIIPITSLPSTPVPPPAPAATSVALPASRVMPRNETELPGALLQNLKASLAHDAAGVAYVDEHMPKPSYGAILNNGAPPK